jgi:hypothetical protein
VTNPQANAPSAPDAIGTRAAWCGLALSTVAAVILIGRLLYLCGSGIDFSDEGYYINCIAHHDLYPTSPTQFGFVYGPLYELVGHNLVLLRQANLLLTVGCGWFFFSLLILDQRRLIGRARAAWLALAFVLSVSTLAILHLWQPTPSYNTLALQGLVLGGCGLGLIRRDAAENRSRGYILLGVAGVLTFLAKPTTAAAAAPLFLACLAARRQLTWRGVIIMTLTCLLSLAMAALAIDASISRFYERLANAAADAEKLQSSYTFWGIVRFDTFSLTRPQHYVLWSGAAFLGVTSWLAASSRGWLRLSSLGLVLSSLTALLVVIGLYHLYWSSLLELYGYELGPFFSYTPTSEWVRRFQNSGVLLLAWPIGALAAFLARFSRRPAWSEMAVALCLLLMPYAYVMGTNVNHWHAMGGAAVFWCAAGLICLGPSVPAESRWSQFLPFAAAAFVGTVLFLLPATEAPYRQRQPLRMNREKVPGVEGVLLRVPDDTAHYIRNVRALLEEHGFRPRDPMIDLTGHSPTLLYLVEARPVGLAWLLGGYPGSEAFVRQGLNRVPLETLQRAWVITEPEGPRALSPLLLQHYGLNLAKDYEEVGAVDTPVAEYSQPLKQYLYKPKPVLSAGHR